MNETNMELQGAYAPQTGMTAQEISDELMEDSAVSQTQEAQTLEAQIREGIGELFEDGWTQEELMALSQDEGVRADVAAGKDVVRAACAYVRRMQAPMRRRGVPVARVSSAGYAMEENPIEKMSDAQFEQFSRQAREAAMMGRKVRM